MMKIVHHRLLVVDHQNGYTAGHFDGHPIVPGAVCLNWLTHTLSEYLGVEKLDSLRVRNLKCIEEVAPPCEAQITVYEKTSAVFHLELKIGHDLKISADMSVIA